MAKKGIYQKYESVLQNEYYDYQIRQWAESVSTSAVSFTVYKTISFSQTSGFILGVPTKYTSSVWNNFPNSYYGRNTSVFLAQSSKPSTGGFGGADISFTEQHTCKVRDIYVKGTYLTDIIADYGSLPTDGRHTDGYWYVFVKMASDLKGNINGVIRDMPEGWAYIDGFWKPQSELKSNINGIFK